MQLVSIHARACKLISHEHKIKCSHTCSFIFAFILLKVNERRGTVVKMLGLQRPYQSESTPIGGEGRGSRLKNILQRNCTEMPSKETEGPETTLDDLGRAKRGI